MSRRHADDEYLFTSEHFDLRPGALHEAAGLPDAVVEMAAR
jgi:hypothetical protein